MTPEDQRYIVEKVGECWHEIGKKWNDPKGHFMHNCSCGKELFAGAVPEHLVDNQLDPDSPLDMYGKIWKAFRKKYYLDFKHWLIFRYGEHINRKYFDILTSAPDLAKAMLTYFKEKEDDMS